MLVSFEPYPLHLSSLHINKKNMDKFGHYIHKRLRLPESFEIFEKALHKGEIDFLSARLTGVASPLKANDAVTKEYVDKQSESFASKEEVRDLVNAIKSDIKKYIQQQKEDYRAKDN